MCWAHEPTRDVSEDTNWRHSTTSVRCPVSEWPADQWRTTHSLCANNTMVHKSLCGNIQAQKATLAWSPIQEPGHKVHCGCHPPQTSE